mmetsp:Transcript_16017/g.20894  ORF Transcript_16017/g.20894 Transcript_16017/m.20894 type:complete len:540 (+) Transcript_16017:46-1665(+)
MISHHFIRYGLRQLVGTSCRPTSLTCRSTFSKAALGFEGAKVVAPHQKEAAVQPGRKSLWEVCLVGRPNVGKSTLFNRLAKSRAAIVSPIPGTTRDRKERKIYFSGMEIKLVDTGGVEEAQGSKLPEVEAMFEQTKLATKSADMVLFVVDAREGVTELDKQFARWLRKEGKGQGKVIMLANKAEGDVTNPLYQDSFVDAERLGFGGPIPISGEHGDGVGSLASALIPFYDQWQSSEPQLAHQENSHEEVLGPLMLTILGRPNVGKSSLMNALLGEKRMLVGPMAGLTRDSVAVDWEFRGRTIRLVDTAGVRRSWKIDRSTPLEEMAVNDAVRSMNLSNVCVVMLDACEGRFVSHEMRLLDLVHKEKRGLVIAANKSDILEIPRQLYERQVKEQLEQLLPSMSDVPVVAISALLGHGLNQLMKSVLDVNESWNKRVSTASLNYWLTDAIKIQPPPKEVKLRYITQIKSRPPTFVLFTNGAEIPRTYMRYLRRRLWEDFKLYGVPLDFVIRKQEKRSTKKKWKLKNKKQLFSNSNIKNKIS